MECPNKMIKEFHFIYDFVYQNMYAFKHSLKCKCTNLATNNGFAICTHHNNVLPASKWTINF